MIGYTCKYEHYLEGNWMGEEWDVDLGSLPFYVHLDSLVRGTKKMSFDQNTLSIDLSSYHSLKSISLNGVIPEHIDIQLTSMSNTKINTRDYFQNSSL